MLMQEMWFLYKKTIVGSMLIVGVLAVSVLVIGREWFSVGVPEDSETVSIQAVSWGGDIPVIETENRKVLQGERVCVRDFATARDIDGQEISEDLIFQDEKGRVLRDGFDTRSPGKYVVTVSVKSRISGMENSRMMVVLVDGRVES